MRVRASDKAPAPLGRLGLSAAALILAAHLAPPAGAQVLGDAQVIEALMAEAGWPVRQSRDDYGDPLIRSVVDGVRFGVHFYGCQDGPCQAIQFSAAFRDSRPGRLPLINAWNRDFRFGKAFLDRAGNPIIEMDVNLAGDGIGGRNFNAVLDIWRGLLSDFRRHLN